MAVLALIIKRWDIALYSYAYLLESATRRGALVKAFTDTEDYFSEEDLVDYISCKLIQDFPNAHWIEQLQHENVELGEKIYPFKSRFQESKLLIRLSDKCIDKVKNALETTLKKGSSISREDSKANLGYVEETKDCFRDLLKELRLALGKSSDIYIKYADKVANQYLNCCINYYNSDKSNPYRARVILKYTRIAYRFAEGKTAKERMKENLEIIEQACENLIPELIEKEFDSIDKMVMDYHEISKTKDYTEHLNTLIEDAYKLIQIIKDKIGRNNIHYIDTSSNFVLFAIQEVRLKKKATSTYTTSSGLFQYTSALHWGRQILDLLAKFDKDEKCQLEYDMVFTAVIDGLNAIKPKPKPIQVSSKLSNTTQSSHSSSTTTSSINTGKSAKEEIKQSHNDGMMKYYLFIALSLLFVLMILLIGLNNRRNSSPSKQIDNNSSIINNQKELEKHINSINDSPTQISSPSSNSDYNQSSEEYSEISTRDNDIQYKTIDYSTGDRPYQSLYGKGNYDSHTQNSLLIRNGSSTDAVVFLERTSGRKVRHVFIRRGENFTMTNIPGGQYIIKVMQGTDWNPERDNGSDNPKGGFMKSRSLSKSESYDAFDYPYPSSGQYGQYEVTLYKVQNGNMQTEYINENELF